MYMIKFNSALYIKNVNWAMYIKKVDWGVSLKGVLSRWGASSFKKRLGGAANEAP